MICTCCQAELTDDAVFCKTCGMKIEKEQAPQEGSPAVNPSCGTPNPGGSKFCLRCGTSLGAAAAPQGGSGGGSPLLKRLLNRNVIIPVAAVLAAVLLIALGIAAATGIGSLLAGNKSKAAMDSACVFAEQGNYGQALSALSGIAPSDRNAKKAAQLRASILEKYKKSVLSQAETMADAGHYDDAVTLLTQALPFLQNDAEVSAKIDEYGQAASVSQLLGQVKDNSSDYSKVFALLQGGMAKYPGNSDLSSAFESYESRYCDSVKQQADSARAAGQYNESEALVQSALGLLPGNSALKQLLDGYRSEKLHVNLFDMIPSNQRIMHETYEFWDNYERSDSLGNSYQTGLFLQHYYKSTDTNFTSELSYDLNGEFHELTGTFATDSSCSSSHYCNVKYFAFLQIYGDGKLLYTTPESRANTSPCKIDLDMTGVSTIRLVIRCFIIDPDLFDFVLER